MAAVGDGLAQHEKSPDGAEGAKRHADQEDKAPVDGGEHTAQDQSDDGAEYGGDLVDAHGEAALVRWEGVGQQGGAVGEEEAAANALNQAEDDELQGGGIARARCNEEQQAADSEDGKAKGIELDAPEDVREASECDEQGGGHNQISQQ